MVFMGGVYVGLAVTRDYRGESGCSYREALSFARGRTAASGTGLDFRPGCSSLSRRNTNVAGEIEEVCNLCQNGAPFENAEEHAIPFLEPEGLAH
jgi:hypothetical protein